MGTTVKILSITLLNYLLFGLFALEYLRRGSRHNVDKNFGNLTLLVIAHPDDETMFFGPTLLNLVHNDHYVEILCLTTGDADNLGAWRTNELVQVVKRLGGKVSLKQVHDDRFPDSMTKPWDLTRVSELIESHVRSSASQIGTLITFDARGVSDHLNHKSIYWAVENMKHKIKDLKLRIFNLKSVGLWRKYLSFSDSMITMYQNYVTTSPSEPITLAVGTSETELTKLLNLHSTQMVWFRKLYMIFSRYMFINDLIEESSDGDSPNSPEIGLNKVNILQ